MTKDPIQRAAAYRDLVGGLIDARVDLASQRFDSAVAEAEAEGQLDPATARVLRWWQRESVRAVTEHARNTLPDAIVALERSAQEAQQALEQSEAAWHAGRAAAARSAIPTDSLDPLHPLDSLDRFEPLDRIDLDAFEPRESTDPDPTPPGPAPDSADHTPTDHTPTDVAPSGPTLPEHLSRATPVEVPPSLTTPAEHASQQRRRTLVAGLTVLPTE